jgi:hypothetical protein
MARQRKLTPVNGRASAEAGQARRAANETWEAWHEARTVRLEAELADHLKSTVQTRKDLRLAKADERSADAAWKKAERAHRTIQEAKAA